VLLMSHDGREKQASWLGVSVNARVPTNLNGLENQPDLGENPIGGMILFLVRLLSQILRDDQAIGSIMTPEDILHSIVEAGAWLPITVVRQAFGHHEVLAPTYYAFDNTAKHFESLKTKVKPARDSFRDCGRHDCCDAAQWRDVRGCWREAGGCSRQVDGGGDALGDRGGAQKARPD
jgi:hypothetical protein